MITPLRYRFVIDRTNMAQALQMLEQLACELRKPPAVTGHEALGVVAVELRRRLDGMPFGPGLVLDVWFEPHRDGCRFSIALRPRARST